jgi:hypothetical protein
MIIVDAEVCHIFDPNYDPTFYQSASILQYNSA